MNATLNYFDLPGRAEATRVSLALGEVPFEDMRLSFDEFAASSFTSLPVMQVCKCPLGVGGWGTLSL